jgi:hypothetical protein
MISLYKIPKIVHFTFENSNFTNEISKIIESNKRICSNYNFKFYDKKARDSFISNNFSTEIYDAYCSLNPILGVCQADFWRYCVLYFCGGVYIDIKTKIKKNLDVIINNKDQFLLDFPKNIYEKISYHQGFLICKPKHLYNLEVIKSISKEINLRKFPKISRKSKASAMKELILRFSGPIKLGEVISKFSESGRKNHRCFDIKSIVEFDYESNFRLYEHNNLQHYSMVNISLYKDTPLKIDYFD